MNATAHIQAGICGFVTKVYVSYDRKLKLANVEIETNCDKIKKMSQLIQEVAPMYEISMGFEGKIMSGARKALDGCCTGCVVPSNIFKSVQVASGLALPMEIGIEIRKENE